VATKIKAVTVADELHELDRKRNIAQRIAAVMGEVDYVQKEKKQGMNYSIVSHDAVTAKVRPLLHKHGVIYYPRGLHVAQNGNRTEAVFSVRFENIDDRTDFIDVETIGYGVDPQDKGPGKAISYGVKYALLKVLGLETGDDPDTVQDERANHTPDGSDATVPRGVGDMSDSALRGCVKSLVHSLHGCGTIEDFDELMEVPETVATIEQCRRRFPNWWSTGAGMPVEFKPLQKIINETREGLRALENQ
jgi:hypothetical protein